MSDKKNIDTISYGNKDGEIKFGHLHLANSGGTESDVTSAVMLQASDSLHYMTMDKDGKRKGWTLNRCPGSYEIKCGTNTPDNQNAFFLQADNGDIVIGAPNGRVRIHAKDISLIANGENNQRGIINIEANESVQIKSGGSVYIEGNKGVKLYTPQNMEIIANTSMGLISNFINGLTAASITKSNKDYLKSTTDFVQKSVYTGK